MKLKLRADCADTHIFQILQAKENLMRKIIGTYPVWFIEGHGYNLYKLSNINLWVSAIDVISFLTVVISTVCIIIHTLVVEHAISTNSISFRIYVTIILLTATATIIASVIKKRTIKAAYEAMRPDWNDLRKKLGPITNVSLLSVTEADACGYLIDGATWLRIFERAMNKNRANQEREQLRANYNLFARSGLLPHAKNSDNPPLGSIVQAAEPKAVDTLTFALNC